MKKKIFYSILYILPIAYLIYCLAHIRGWVTSHLDFSLYVLIPVAAAVVMAVVLLVLKLCKKPVRPIVYAPVLLAAVGLMIAAVGAGIPCCTGG